MYLSSIYLIFKLLCGIWEGRGFGSTYFAFSYFLFFYYVWIYVCLFGSRGVFDFSRKIYSSVVATLVTVFCDFSVGFCIEILWFYCWYVSYIAWHVRVDGIVSGLLLLLRLVAGNVAHVSDYGILFGTSGNHWLSYIIWMLLINFIRLEDRNQWS